MIPGSGKARFGLIDVVVLCTVAAAVWFVLARLQTGMNYRWQWGVLADFVIRRDPVSGDWVPNIILLGLFTTLRLALWGGVVALVVGLAIGLMRVVPSPTARTLAAVYVGLIRNIPPLVFLFIFYFFLSSQVIPLTGLQSAVRSASPQTLAALEVLFGPPRQIGPFLSAAAAIGLYAAAFIAEIIRAGVNAVGTGQMEAAQALGMGWASAMRRVILPQALARVWAPLANEFILMIKFSALASLVSVPDLTFQAQQAGITTRSMFEVWLLVAAIYFVICFGLASLFGALERRAMRAR
ncbi:amino acid ABC transporter permease [Rhodobacter ferrooxidans]|uniref:Polar amino acid ABC transporter, inner membrane subunit n=1 Tax=Rhodobacter ferrooxidans TaxID=371731 RepID=C8RZY5_9RHOB|nr:amino acid ABC transporter permease [Rhodobacter sp. SW2]EEW25594.1 polar amino acid ABC transporter, inner membrane subunit [Rhodobacter sp. SW2]